MTSEKEVDVLCWTTLALVIAFGLILYLVFDGHKDAVEKLNADHKVELAQAATDAYLLGTGCEDLSSCNLRITVKPYSQSNYGVEYIVAAGVVVKVGLDGAKSAKTVLPSDCTGQGEPLSFDGFPAGSQTSLPANCYPRITEVVPPLVAQ